MISCLMLSSYLSTYIVPAECGLERIEYFTHLKKNNFNNKDKLTCYLFNKITIQFFSLIIYMFRDIWPYHIPNRMPSYY